MYSFFFAIAQRIYYSHMYNKTDRKPTDFHQVDFCEKLIYCVFMIELQVKYRRSFRM